MAVGKRQTNTYFTLCVPKTEKNADADALKSQSNLSFPPHITLYIAHPQQRLHPASELTA